MERGRDEIRHNTLASIMVFWEPRNLACSLCIILCNAMSILIVRNRLCRFCRPLSVPSSPSSYPLAFRFPSLPKASSRIWKPKKRCQFSLARRNFCRMPSTTPSCSRIPRVYIMPATCVLYPACISSTSSSRVLSSQSSSSCRNRPSPFRKYLRLMAMLIFRHVRDWAQRTTNMMYSSYDRVRSIYKTKDKEERRRNQELNRMKTLYISAKLG